MIALLLDLAEGWPPSGAVALLGSGDAVAHQQVDHVADEQKRAVLDVPVAVEKPSVQDGRQDDQGDAPDEDSKRPDLACVLGAAQAECGDDELNQAHGEDDDSQSDGGGVCRGLGIAQSHRLVHSHRGGRHSERDEGGAR